MMHSVLFTKKLSGAKSERSVGRSSLGSSSRGSGSDHEDCEDSDSMGSEPSHPEALSAVTLQRFQEASGPDLRKMLQVMIPILVMRSMGANRRLDTSRWVCPPLERVH